MDTFTKRLAVVAAARKAIEARAEAALATIHPDDRELAETIAHENAADSLHGSGRTFAFRKLVVCTLELVCDDADAYDLRRAR